MKNKKFFLFCIMLTSMNSSVFAALDSIWVGNTSTTWSTPANWNTDPNIPGQTDNSRVYFGNPSDSAYMPALSSAQPSGTFQIQELVFTNSGWTLSGIDALTLNKGNVALGTGTSNPYIRSNGTGTNTIECPVIFGSGSGGFAVALAESNSHLKFSSGISYTGSARGMMFAGGGSFELNGAFAGPDLIVSGSSKLMLANASGVALAPTSAGKLRINTGSAQWMYNDQLGKTSSSFSLLRIDGNGYADLNGKTQTVSQITFAIDTTECGTVDTGANGMLNVFVRDGMIVVGSASTIPTSTAFVRGNIATMDGVYDTCTIWTRRGTQDVDLVIDAAITGLCSIAIDKHSSWATPGIVVFNGTNTFAGTTKVKAGTLRINTQGAPGISVGKVEVSAGARLEGTSTIDPASSSNKVRLWGILAPGDPIGTLTIGSSGSENDIEMNSGSSIEIRMNESGCASLAVFGSIAMTGTTSLDLVAESRPPTGTYLIASATGTIGNFTSITGETGELQVFRSPNNKQLWLRVTDLGTIFIVR